MLQYFFIRQGTCDMPFFTLLKSYLVHRDGASTVECALPDDQILALFNAIGDALDEALA